MAELIEVPAGLADVAVTATEIGDVLGNEGLYHYRGRSAIELARTGSSEQVASFVLDGSEEPFVADRALPPGVGELAAAIDLRSGISLLGSAIGCRPLVDISVEQRRADAVRLVSAFPTLVASIRHGVEAVPDPSLGHVADHLRMIRGEAGTAQEVAALEAYFVLTIDHGFSNATFTTRVVASAGADLGACVLAGYTALSGPRHGFALERILDMFDSIGDAGRAEEWMRNEIAAGRRIQGFGHSVYRTDDPRAVLLKEIAASVTPERHEMAAAVEEAGTAVLAGRRLRPNLDLYAAVVLEGCGIPRGWFGATFATARVAGWCAHAIEQAKENKIIRPAAYYIGPPPHLG
jgi:citrate synthase